MHTDIVISHFVIWTSMRALSYYNGSQRTQNNKTAAPGTTDITLPVPETQQTIMKPGNATSQSIINVP
jgi:hypothetical protein